MTELTDRRNKDLSPSIIVLYSYLTYIAVCIMVVWRASLYLLLATIFGVEEGKQYDDTVEYKVKGRQQTLAVERRRQH